MDNPDELLVIQREVQTKLGRNLLNYQSIEILLKFIISTSTAEIRKDPSGEFKVKRPKSERMMLGQLIGIYVSDVALSELVDDVDEIVEQSPESDTILMKFKFQQIFDGLDEHGVMADKTKILVDDRNALVHHFREKYKLDSISSCKSALKYLEDKNNFTIEQFEYFKNLATQLKELIKIHVDIISSDDFFETISTECADSNSNHLN